jgi:predicted Zn-dependent protease
MHAKIEESFHRNLPAVDFCSLRLVDERSENICVRQDVLEPVHRSTDLGAMITVIAGGGLGYAATSDLSEAGIRSALSEAHNWAKRTAGKCVVDFSKIEMASPQGEYRTPVRSSWTATSLKDKVSLLMKESQRLKTDDRIVDWEAGMSFVETRSLYITSAGGRVEQELSQLAPSLVVTANEGTETQTRTLNGHGPCRQGGLEVLEEVGFLEAAPVLAAEALQLLGAPNCPSGTMDILLAPDQMILQIHESIGHPLELDRILGDERNYAGTTFVTLDMFGSYRYGSELLNITFDPTLPNEFASFGFDDEGQPATKEYLIRGGILERPLGAGVSQQRASMAGVANSRAQSWNRPPIDRMANLNLEIGSSSLPEMINAVERGIYMKSNCSWSIDDSRNKFQFGCEWAQLIEDGELTAIVKKPNYRGVSGTFWRNLRMVGDEKTHDILGTPNCGKGEPNQVIRVGHASPACLFSNVEVFGGE